MRGYLGNQARTRSKTGNRGNKGGGKKKSRRRGGRQGSEETGNFTAEEKTVGKICRISIRRDLDIEVDNPKILCRNSFDQFNISVEQPAEESYQQIIHNISSGKSGIQLPYLQVYHQWLEEVERYFL